MAKRSRAGATVFECAAVVLVLALGLSAAEHKPVSPDHAERMKAGVELFKKHVRTILRRRCLKCHGGEQTKADFDLSHRDLLLESRIDLTLFQWCHRFIVMTIQIKLDERDQHLIGIRGEKPLLVGFGVIRTMYRVSKRVEGSSRLLSIAPAKAVKALEWHLLTPPSTLEAHFDLDVAVSLEQAGSLAGNRDKFCAKPRRMSGLEECLVECPVTRIIMRYVGRIRCGRPIVRHRHHH